MNQLSGGKLILGAAVAAAIFAFDLLLPLGVAAGVPYVFLVLLGMWAPNTRHVFALAALGSILTIAGYLLSAMGGVPWVVLTNRALAFFVIWSTALLVAHRKQGQEALKQAFDELEERVNLRTVELRENEAQLRMITDHLPILIAYIDTEERYRFANSKFEEIFMRPRSQIIGHRLADLTGAEAYEKLRPRVHSALSGEMVQFETELVYPDGVPRSLDLTYVPDFTETGEVKGYFGLGIDITERKSAEEDRNQALIEAEKANKAKTEFLAGMSHELRTPLNAILGFAEIISLEYFGPLGQQKYKEYAADIYASGEHLLALISDILDISTIEAGKVSLNKEHLPIEEVVSECMNVVANNAATNGLALKTELADAPPSIFADRRAIRQILLNILTNAIKFTPPGGNIDLRARESENDIVLEIEDTGSGFPEDKLHELTEPFARLEQDPYRPVEGWGLGLAITKSLIDLHQGTLEINSQVGHGTTVTVRIPKHAP